MKYLKVLSLLAVVSLLSGCNNTSASTSNSNASTNSSTSGSTSSSSSTSSYDYDDIDIDDTFAKGEEYEADDDESISAKIILDGENASISYVDDESAKVSIDDNGVLIEDAGTYLIESTSLYTKSIVINLAKKNQPTLILNGVGISKISGYAPIVALEKAQLKIKKAKNSKNYIYDGRNEDYDGDDNAAIFANKKLEITGKGSLTVISTFNNGIGSDASISMKNGEVTIVSKNNCLKAHKAIEIEEEDSDGGTYQFESSEGQCIKTEPSDDATDDELLESTITLTKGNYILKSAEDGIEAYATISILGGDYQIISGGGSYGKLDKDSGSFKAIKSDTEIDISGGTFHINSLDDAIHTNGIINISGGDISIESGDDGIHADDTFTLSDGTIVISKSYEGIEAETLYFKGGTTSIVASDDGVNAAGGSDSNKSDPWSSGSTGTLYIEGGYLFINASGDGLDSNGSIYVAGGYTVVAGPTSGGDGPLDVGDGGNYFLSQSGGTLIAYGNYSMAINASKGSQKTMLFNHSNSIDSNYYYVLKDSSNNVLNVIKPYKTSSSLYYSTPDLGSSTYTLSYIKASSLTSTLDEVYFGVYTSSASISGDTSIGSINLSSTTNGSYGSSGQGGGGHGGGGQGGPGGGPGGR